MDYIGAFQRTRTSTLSVFENDVSSNWTRKAIFINQLHSRPYQKPYRDLHIHLDYHNQNL